MFQQMSRRTSGGNVPCIDSVRKLLEGQWRRNLGLCSLKSSELELKGFETAAVKSDEFHFYSCQGTNSETFMTDSISPVLAAMKLSARIAVALCKLLCRVLHLSRGVSEADSPFLWEKTLLRPLQRCAWWRSFQKEIRHTYLESFSGLGKTTEVKGGWRVDHKNNLTKM